MSKLESYTQEVLRLLVNKAFVVIPWSKVQFVSYSEEAGQGVLYCADTQVHLNYLEAKKVAEVLELVLKGHPVENIDFDSED